MRKNIKKKKPFFARQDSHKKKKLGTKWRKPRGLHSKIRLCKKGYRRSVSKGYKSPLPVRGLHPSGLKEIKVMSVKNMEGIDKEKEGVTIAGNTGLKKKMDIVKNAIEKSITILNIKDPTKFLKETEEGIKKKKGEKEKKLSDKEKKRKEKEEKAAEKKKKKDGAEEKKKDETEVEVKEEEEKKKEKDKLLIKREI